MSGEDWADDTEGGRIDSLVRFGFDRADIEAFLTEHEGGQRERLTWLEERRETASELEDRIAAFSQHSVPGFEVLEPYKSQLSDPFTIEETFLEVERELRSLAPWEPPLNREKEAWFGEGHGDMWSMLYERLAALDVSSHAAVAPLHRLFGSPLSIDELLRHLELVEADEQRQRQMIQNGADHLRGLGYALGETVEQPLLEALNQLEQWQGFHAKKECRLARSLKYVVEQSSFVYADAVSKWRHALEEKFDIFRDSKLLDIATLEHLLGKKRDGSEEPDHSPAPLLRALCNVESNLQSRSDVYKEFFSPTPLGGDALCSHLSHIQN